MKCINEKCGIDLFPGQFRCSKCGTIQKVPAEPKKVEKKVNKNETKKEK